jgi:muramoyltetrapeptide carboxypeptidase
MKKIQPGSTIGVVAPAWIPIPERLDRGKKYLEKCGYHVRFSKHINEQFKYFAGTDNQRLADLTSMFADPEIDAIMCARGGWGTLRLVNLLDYELIKENPKPLVGYSDITTLQLAIWGKTGMPSFSGPMVAVEMGKGIHPFTEKHFWGLMNSESPFYMVDIEKTRAEIINSGMAGGLLLGGCLAMVSTLLGTPYSPDYTDAILFIEDIGEKPYKIDRYLAHLKQAGVFDKIKALILGEFLDCTPDAGERSFTLAEIFTHYFEEYEFPLITQFPYGHGDIKITMPIGCYTELDTSTKTIRFTNPFYKSVTAI